MLGGSLAQFADDVPPHSQCEKLPNNCKILFTIVMTGKNSPAIFVSIIIIEETLYLYLNYPNYLENLPLRVFQHPGLSVHTAKNKKAYCANEEHRHLP